MKIVSVNRGSIKTYPWRNGTQSGMLKTPVAESIFLGKEGLEGDGQGDAKNHGGQDKAVLMIPEQNYALFKIEEPFGFIGETLTFSGADETTICLGDRFQIGEVLLEVSQPRSPCWKLNEITQRPNFLQTYAESGRVGIYCRVLQTGKLKAGEIMVHIPVAAQNSQNLPGLAVFDLFLAKYHHQTSEQIELLKRAVKQPALSAAWRAELGRLIEKAENEVEGKTEKLPEKPPKKVTKKERTQHWIKPPKAILKPVGRAIAQYKMLKDGDRVLLGLSGGKDSMALLVVLKHLQRHAPIQFDLAACTIDPEIPGFDPSPLKDWCQKMEVPYFYESEDLVALAEAHMKGNSFCSFCARQKRGKLYTVCRREGYNVLALAQHLDDLAESLMMSAFNAGELRTMKAHYLNNDQDIRIIRPLVRVRENQTRDFAKVAGLPIIPDNCPACYAKPQERQRMKALLLSEEQHNPHLYANLWRAMQPLIEDDNHDGQAHLDLGVESKND